MFWVSNNTSASTRGKGLFTLLLNFCYYFVVFSKPYLFCIWSLGHLQNNDYKFLVYYVHEQIYNLQK